jgi:hypothetical protein
MSRNYRYNFLFPLSLYSINQHSPLALLYLPGTQDEQAEAPASAVGGQVEYSQV